MPQERKSTIIVYGRTAVLIFKAADPFEFESSPRRAKRREKERAERPRLSKVIPFKVRVLEDNPVFFSINYN